MTTQEQAAVATLRGHVARLLGVPVTGWRPVSGGWSVALKGVVELAGGRTVFAKLGDIPDTMAALRAECGVYELLSAPFVPRLLAADPTVPVLVIEDLSAATWPPPWTPELLAGLDALFAQLAATRAPAGLQPLGDRVRQLGAWELVAADPGPLLAAGLVAAGWLDRCLPALLAAERAAPTAGDRLVHLDVRSDNVCFRGDGRAMLVDWNGAVAGDPRWDRLLMLPTIQLEGGPPVRELAHHPDPGIVAWLAGFFAARAGLPPPAGAPRVRGFQRAQLEIALPWAADLLGLPAPDPPEPVSRRGGRESA
ncbi:MAG TPA: phosphotransferase [Candidatus Dormibacteraeota bacterium]